MLQFFKDRVYKSGNLTHVSWDTMHSKNQEFCEEWNRFASRQEQVNLLPVSALRTTLRARNLDLLELRKLLDAERSRHEEQLKEKQISLEGKEQVIEGLKEQVFSCMERFDETSARLKKTENDVGEMHLNHEKDIRAKDALISGKDNELRHVQDLHAKERASLQAGFDREREHMHKSYGELERRRQEFRKCGST